MVGVKMHKFSLKTTIYTGNDCLRHINLSDYGNRGLIITSSNSGKRNGAIEEIIKSTDSMFTIYDKVTPNPALTDIYGSIPALSQINP